MSARMGALYEEHVILGASFEEGPLAGALAVSSYAGEKDLGPSLGGAVVSDLTGTTYQLLSGPSAPELAEAALAGRRLAVGEAAFEAVLTGEGRLVAAPLALRTGDHEYVLCDPEPEGAAAVAWVGFLSGVERDGYAPYEGSALEDASRMLVPILLAGERSRAVLSDYVRTAGESLPGPGRVASLHLDAIPALVARVPARGPEAWLLLVPARSARVLWRSLLSFTEVEPVGTRAARELWARARPLPAGPPRVPAPRAELARLGLVRADGGFVGERALGD
ncbi:hypothetical protein [Thermophilibacter mediterraneus]|uniref:hypothetical protein n=1 Tax=Thermophilibacter mediterraneus TaxID=1871031 RepID=UPI002354AA97|nr:hypothetical protein [Thermophilibacter mediterraneus]